MNREDYIGGSDIAPIIGLGHFRSRIDVYLQKLGIGDPVETNKAMKWGKRMEWQMLQVLAEDKDVFVMGYDRDGELVVFMPNSQIIPARDFKFPIDFNELTVGDVGLMELSHPEFDYMAGHIDGVVFDHHGEVIGFADAKTSSMMRLKEWGDAGSDHIPMEYQFQFAFYGELLRLKLGRAVPCYVPVLIGGNDDRVYKVEHSESMVADLFPILHEFWNENVKAEVPPSAEPTELGKKALSKLYPEDTGEVLQADEQLTILAETLKVHKQEFKEAEDNKTASENQIKDQMGDASRLEGNGWYLTWKKSKDSTGIDWEAVVMELLLWHIGEEPLIEMTEESYRLLDTITEKHIITTKKGGRKFLTTGLKGLEI